MNVKRNKKKKKENIPIPKKLSAPWESDCLGNSWTGDSILFGFLPLFFPITDENGKWKMKNETI